MQSKDPPFRRVFAFGELIVCVRGNKSPPPPVSSSDGPCADQEENDMSDNGDHCGSEIDRRGALECMIWAGTGVLWTLSGGVPKSLGLLGEAHAAEATGFSFLQISDSHVGFDKPANPNALGTLQEAIAKVKALPGSPT